MPGKNGISQPSAEFLDRLCPAGRHSPASSSRVLGNAHDKKFAQYLVYRCRRCHLIARAMLTEEGIVLV
jgi:hypothetical protein